jgi:hypothetical protein
MSTPDRVLTVSTTSEPPVLTGKFPRVHRRKNSGAIEYSGHRNDLLIPPGVLQSMAINMTDSAATVNQSEAENDNTVFDRDRFDCLLEAACTGKSADETIAELRLHLHSHPEAGWTRITEKGNEIVTAALNSATNVEMKEHFERHTNLTNMVSRVTERILNQSVA